MTDRVTQLDTPDWFLQPGDRLAKSVCEALAAEPVFKRIFGESIFDYLRMDISVREMPAIRVYNETGRKEAETWYLTGDLKLDIILPPSTRRSSLQRFPDLLVSALLAWVRAQPTLRGLREKVPGLNQFGWFFSFDKSLAFKPGAETDPVPLTQVIANYRVNLNEWDEFAESNDREQDTPFRQTLADLERIYVSIEAKDEDGSTAATVGVTSINTEA